MIKQQILRLEISMRYFELAHVLDAINDLMEKSKSYFFSESFSLDDVVEELSACSHFHDEEEMGVCLDDFVELDEVGVPDLLEDCDFSGDSFDVCFVPYSVFFEYFNSYFFACEDVDALFYFSECALTESFSWEVRGGIYWFGSGRQSFI